MRLIILACVVWAFFSAFGVPSFPGAVAATTGQVTITGNVPIACDIDVRQDSGAVSIPDISAGDTNRKIATVTENCNSPDGYTVSMTGSNSGDYTGMFVDTVSGDSHPFTVRYDSVSVSPGGIVTDNTLPAFDINKIVDITYPADETLTGTLSASYEETLIFTISAK